MLKEGEELAEEFAFVDVQVTLCPVKESPACQAEAANEFDGGEAAALLLIGRLRENPLIFRGIRHGQAGAVDDLDVSAAPELIGPCAALEFIGGMPMNGKEGIVGYLGTGAAIGGGAGTWAGLTPVGIPRLDLADGFTAGAFRRENLGEEGPECQTFGKESNAAMGATCRGFQKLGWYPWRTEPAELGERGPLKGSGFVQEFVSGRTAGATEEESVETGEEWCCIIHM
jgi:hypothetical protein